MSKGLRAILNDDGVFEVYDDTYDLIIHCENEEEQEEVFNRLNWRWIPVSERLPEKNDIYVVWTSKGFGDHLSTSYYSTDYGWTIGVCAWKENEEPYKTEGSNKE